MRGALVRWIRLLSVACPTAGLCSPVEGCFSAMGQEPPVAKSPQTPSASQPTATIAATVNGEPILLAEVDAILKRRPPVSTPLTTEQARQLRIAVAEGLVDDLLIKQFLRTNGPKVEAQELEAHFQALTVALRRHGKTPADYLREAAITEAQAREIWTNLIAFDKYVSTITTDAELKKYFETYRPAFDGTQVRASHIVIRVPAGSPAGERTSARQKLMSIRQEILQGKMPFTEAAKRFSMCPSAVKGGDLGFVTLRDSPVEQAVVQQAFAMQANQLSEPVESSYGVHLVLTTARRPGTPITYEQVADQVRDYYTDDVRQRLVDRLRKEAVIQITVP